MLPGRLSELPPWSFAKLATLLDSAKTRAAADQSGGRRSAADAVPAFVAEALARTHRSFGTYPPINGTAGVARGGGGVAAVGGLRCRRTRSTRREPAAAERHARGTVPRTLHRDAGNEGGRTARVLLPNPFYQCYAAAILVAPAPSRCSCRRRAETGFLPDYASLPKTLLERTVGGLYLLALQSRRRLSRAKTIGARCSRWPIATTSRCSPTSAMPTSISTSRRSAR